MARRDSDTASWFLPACGQCVGVSVLTNRFKIRLRQTHALGGQWRAVATLFASAGARGRRAPRLRLGGGEGVTAMRVAVRGKERELVPGAGLARRF